MSRPPHANTDRQLGQVGSKQPVVVNEAALRSWLGRRTDDTEATRSALLDALLDACEEGVFVLDEAGEIILANRAGASLIEHDSDALLSLLRAATPRSDEPSDDGADAWARGPLRAWRRPLVVEGSRHALVVVDSEEDLVERAVATAARAWSLTTRQLEVLRLVLAGLPTKQIAAALASAPKTIDVHLGALFDKADVSSRAALVANVFKLPRPGRL